eukprot:CAMPEP_0117851836 /NCGR_PEP_ID=MMETSP0949-20121206/22660_1 /TAXON_ID=44440 /ORGANISM="Chattonella subsalsa, Strain CCMP2191" /LENGTH=46 /DNA_ID= /DNA_START= /DNA_END= /DNA_ORIENTATION=
MSRIESASPLRHFKQPHNSSNPPRAAMLSSKEESKDIECITARPVV